MIDLVTRAPGAPAVFGETLPGPEWPVRDEAGARALLAALDRGERVAAALAAGETGVDVYRAAAIAARVLGGRVPVRVRWDAYLGIKAATLALLFGADELTGPLAPPEIQRRIALAIPIIGGPPEDPARPTRTHVENLIRAAERTPVFRSAA